jgi:DNA-binding response OmpR family regulator
MTRVDDACDEAAPLVLLVDDDDALRSFVRVRLEADGLRVIEASSGEEGLDLLTADVSVVLVDVGLPRIDGFGVVRAIRRSSTVPIVMMTAAADESDRVLGLELGADDYIVKPFLPREMLARVRAAIRRAAIGGPATTPTAKREAGGVLVIDTFAREARIDGAALRLTTLEFDLLAYLAASPRRVFSRDQLLHNVWHIEPGWVGDATVTEHVHRLRRELERHPTFAGAIVTVRGIGYRYDPSPGIN